MSVLKTNKVQIGQSGTATQNFVLEVPASPDGTVALRRGIPGATTQDILSVAADGTVSISNGSTLSAPVGVTVYEYANRGQLRTTTPNQGAQAIVRGVGLFIWVSGDTSLDDDETCFATASGRWLLEAIGWDFVDSQLPYVPKVLTQTFPNTLTTLSANTSVSFVVTLMGLTAGTAVTVNFLGTLPARGTVTAYSVINNQVTVVVSNTSETSSITIPTGNWVVSALV